MKFSNLKLDKETYTVPKPVADAFKGNLKQKGDCSPKVAFIDKVLSCVWGQTTVPFSPTLNYRIRKDLENDTFIDEMREPEEVTEKEIAREIVSHYNLDAKKGPVKGLPKTGNFSYNMKHGFEWNSKPGMKKWKSKKRTLN